jgi:2-aminoadipate transaminase
MEFTEEHVSFTHRFAARTRADVGEGLVAILALAGATDIISFAGGFPDPATFPDAKLADILRSILEGGDHSALQYAPTVGLPGTLDFVTARLGRLEGNAPGEGELMITSGGIEALELLGKSFIDAGDNVALEGPTYLGAIMGFKSFEAALRAFSMDEQGLKVDEVADALASGYRPKLFYSIPDHQNPAGVTLSRERRTAFVDLARRYGFLIVEDVAYRELGFRGEPEPSLWSLGPDVVVQAGTFSKLFTPGVRLGWGAGPAEVIHQMILAKQNTDQCAGALGQRLLEEYGRAGHLDAQIQKTRALYRGRCELLMQALDAHMPDEVSWTRPQGGFFSWASVDAPVDTTELARRAVEEGIAFVPGAPFFPDGRGGRELRLAFSRMREDEVDEGVKRLAALLSQEVK